MSTPRTLLNLLRSFRKCEARAYLDYNTRPLVMWDMFNNTQGVNLLGCGSFSIVVEVEGRVYKVVKSVDRAYHCYVEFCLENDSPYLPVFKDILEIRGFTVYELEKLQMDQIWTFQKSIEAINSYRFGRDRQLPADLRELIDRMRDRVSEKGLWWDLHNGNFAVRGNHQLVMIDPWC